MQHDIGMYAFDMNLLQSSALLDVTSKEHRKASSKLLRDLFLRLNSLVQPDVIFEIGANEATFSKLVRKRAPKAKIFAFEANPYNYILYSARPTFPALKIDYRHVAVSDSSGDITFYVQRSRSGAVISRNTGSNSILQRIGDVEQDPVTVKSVSMTDFIEEQALSGTMSAWIDVEGANEKIFKGIGKYLDQFALIHCEVEERTQWQGQWLWHDVLEHLLTSGFVPVARDFEYSTQHNVVLVRSDLLKAQKVRHAITQHYSLFGKELQKAIDTDNTNSLPSRSSESPAIQVTSTHSAPKILIATRFGLGIKDPLWFEHRLVLFEAITLSSILRQSDQNFLWVIFVDSDIDATIEDRLSELLRPLGKKAVICKNMTCSETALIALAGPSSYYIVSRIDDDDAWHVETVRTVRRIVDDWLLHFDQRDDIPGLGLTFRYGYEWLMYDMLDVDKHEKGVRKIHQNGVRDYHFDFLGMSCFILRRAAYKQPFLQNAHTKILAELESRGFHIKVEENTEPMWLYCRHKQADSSVNKARAELRPIDINELSKVFGINASKTRDYVNTSDQHAYTAKRVMDKRRALLVERNALLISLSGDTTDSSAASRLQDIDIELGKMSTSLSIIGSGKHQ